jgi:hypothetical protein
MEDKIRKLNLKIIKYNFQIKLTCVQRWLRLDRLMLDPKDKRAIRE